MLPLGIFRVPPVHRREPDDVRRLPALGGATFLVVIERLVELNYSARRRGRAAAGHRHHAALSPRPGRWASVSAPDSR